MYLRRQRAAAPSPEQQQERRSSVMQRTQSSGSDDPTRELFENIFELRTLLFDVHATRDKRSVKGKKSSDRTASAVDEANKYVVDARSEAFKIIKALVLPIERQVAEQIRRLVALGHNRQQAELLEEKRKTVLSLCIRLGESPQKYLPSKDADPNCPPADVAALLSAVETHLRSLLHLQVQRLEKLNAKVRETNSILKEMMEPVMPLFEIPESVPQESYADISPSTSTGKLQPEGSSISVVPAHDLSENKISEIGEALKDVQARRNERIELIRRLGTEIVSLWKEDNKVPSLIDENIKPIDRRLLMFMKSSMQNVAGTLGISPQVPVELAERKQELLHEKKDRIHSALEMTKRLKLIEDRHYLLDAMRQFEANAKNPLRLFGRSGILQKEEKFRLTCYPRLLMIEAVLRTALLLFKARHGRPFLYRGADYLELFDTELKSRVIPRDVFPLLSRKECSELLLDESHRKMPQIFLEMLFGRGVDYDVYCGVEKAISEVIDKHIPDFARVVHLASAVTDVLAEHFMTVNSELEYSWMDGEQLSYGEKTAVAEQMKMRELGWQVPSKYAEAPLSSHDANQIAPAAESSQRAFEVSLGGSQKRAEAEKRNAVAKKVRAVGYILTPFDKRGISSAKHTPAKPLLPDLSSPGSAVFSQQSFTQNPRMKSFVGKKPPPISLELEACNNPLHRDDEGRTCTERREHRQAVGTVGEHVLAAQQQEDYPTSGAMAPLIRADLSAPGASELQQQAILSDAQPQTARQSAPSQRGLHLSSLPTAIFPPPEAPLVLEANALLPASARRILWEQEHVYSNGRIVVTSAQLERMREARHTRFADRAIAKDVKREFDKAFRRRPQADP